MRFPSLPPPHAWLLSGTSRERVSLFGFVLYVTGTGRCLPSCRCSWPTPCVGAHSTADETWRRPSPKSTASRSTSTSYATCRFFFFRFPPSLLLQTTSTTTITHPHPPPPPRASSLQNLLGVMEAVPVSSGFALGSANWILRTDNEKVYRRNPFHPHPRTLDSLLPPRRGPPRPGDLRGRLLSIAWTTPAAPRQHPLQVRSRPWHALTPRFPVVADTATFLSTATAT